MAVDIFLVIPPVPTVPALEPPVSAEPVADQYFATTFKGASVVEVREFSLGEENLSSIGSATTGAGAGKAKLNDLVVVKSVDQLSRSLFAMSVTGRHFSKCSCTSLRLLARPPAASHTSSTVSRWYSSNKLTGALAAATSRRLNV